MEARRTKVRLPYLFRPRLGYEQTIVEAKCVAVGHAGDKITDRAHPVFEFFGRLLSDYTKIGLFVVSQRAKQIAQESAAFRELGVHHGIFIYPFVQNLL